MISFEIGWDSGPVDRRRRSRSGKSILTEAATVVATPKESVTVRRRVPSFSRSIRALELELGGVLVVADLRDHRKVRLYVGHDRVDHRVTKSRQLRLIMAPLNPQIEVRHAPRREPVLGARDRFRSKHPSQVILECLAIVCIPQPVDQHGGESGSRQLCQQPLGWLLSSDERRPICRRSALEAPVAPPERRRMKVWAESSSESGCCSPEATRGTACTGAGRPSHRPVAVIPCDR